MRRLLLTAAGLLAVCTGCDADGRGAAATAPATATTAALTTSTVPPSPRVAFADRPDVRFGSSGGDRWWMLVTAHVDRELPRDGAMPAATFVIRAADDGDESAEAVPGLRRCYQQHLVTSTPPQDGARVRVALRVRGRRPQTVVAHARFVRQEPGPLSHERIAIARRVGCVRRPGDHVCDGRAVAAEWMLGIGVNRAMGGATCATARRVLVAVGTWADSRRCFQDLCVASHRMNRGFRCAVAKVGEADWEITCRRGRQVVLGSVAE